MTARFRDASSILTTNLKWLWKVTGISTALVEGVSTIPAFVANGGEFLSGADFLLTRTRGPISMALMALTAVLGLARFVQRRRHLPELAQRADPEQRKEIDKWIESRFRSDGPPPDTTRQFANTSSLMVIVNNLNYASFENTIYNMDREELSKRNFSIFKKNPHAFLLILAPNRTGNTQRLPSAVDAVGFSCVLPLNEGGASAYRRGKLEDREVDGAYIVAPKEKPSAVLLFSLATRNPPRPLGEMRHLLATAVWHLRFVLADHSVPIYAQTSNRQLRKILASSGFLTKRGRLTGDGEDLWILDTLPPG